jgi:hypothetical protein
MLFLELIDQSLEVALGNRADEPFGFLVDSRIMGITPLNA